MTVIHLGEKLELEVSPDDECHWERVDKEIQEELQDAIDTAPNLYFRDKLLNEKEVPVEIKQVRIWSDGQDGHVEY